MKNIVLLLIAVVGITVFNTGCVTEVVVHEPLPVYYYDNGPSVIIYPRPLYYHYYGPHGYPHYYPAPYRR